MTVTRIGKVYNYSSEPVELQDGTTHDVAVLGGGLVEELNWVIPTAQTDSEYRNGQHLVLHADVVGGAERIHFDYQLWQAGNDSRSAVWDGEYIRLSQDGWHVASRANRFPGVSEVRWDGAQLALIVEADGSVQLAAPEDAAARRYDTAQPMVPHKTTERLAEGNRRWVDNTQLHPRVSSVRRSAQAAHQDPFATIFTCSDSRVSPEFVFDRGVGDLFVARTAGHVIDNAALGSIEYGVEHLHISSLLVLGHEGCGAVRSTVEHVQDGDHPCHPEENGQICYLIEAIKPAVFEALATHPPDDEALLSQSIKFHVRNTVADLRSRAPFLNSADVSVTGAVYDTRSGTIELLG
jgi:carbonic anhydrase